MRGRILGQKPSYGDLHVNGCLFCKEPALLSEEFTMDWD